MPTSLYFKGSERQCIVVELRLQYGGQIFHDSFETYNTILRRIFTAFDRKVAFQNYIFGWIRFENRLFFQILSNDDKKCNTNSTVN